MSAFEVVAIEIAKLALKPGDVLVIRTPDNVRVEGRHEIALGVRKILPGIPIMILPKSLDVEAISHEVISSMIQEAPEA